MVNSQSLPPAPRRRRLWMETFSPGLGRFLLAFICLVLLLGPLASFAADPPPNASAGPLLRSFKIIGAKLVPKKSLKAEITMPMPSMLPWKRPPVFKEDELAGDLVRLKAYYQRQGFYHTEIVPKIETADNQVKVEIHITEGPYVQVVHEEVAVAPTTPPLDLSALPKKWPLKPGDRFTVDTYEALKRLYLDYLLDHGHPRAQTEGKVLLDEEKNTARIEVTIKPGPLYYFGDLKISGKQETPGYLVQRQLTFKPGDVFSVKELYDSQRKLYALDLFQSVTMTPGEEQGNRIPVEVVLQEKKKRSVKIGLGYGDEDRFRAKLGLRFRNLGGGGRTLDIDGKHSSIEDRVTSTFTNPQLWGSHNDFILQSGYIRRYLPGFTDRSYFTQERLERELPWKIKGYIGHGLEFARPFNISEETLAILTQTTPGKLYRASMLLLGLRRETMDSLVDPRQGGRISWTGEAAPDFFGSNLQFLRTVAEVRRYHALGDTNIILAGRLKFGVIEPIQGTQQIPIFRRFFAGGYDSVRGYRLDYLGPRNASGQPLGGEALTEGSLEARIPLYKDFRAAVFVDFGNVFLKVHNIDLGQLKYAPGLELRYMTPIGPLGVGIGIPTNPINGHKDNYRVFFSIGQAF
ncbi:MAG: BamA/TamA family outer membrane protein [Deltaproteobacteria bacterium]|nr:BamA/TamA family outer membrane protein [Deltaproteobacteria bacterium]